MVSLTSLSTKETVLVPEFGRKFDTQFFLNHRRRGRKSSGDSFVDDPIEDLNVTIWAPHLVKDQDNNKCEVWDGHGLSNNEILPQ